MHRFLKAFCIMLNREYNTEQIFTSSVVALIHLENCGNLVKRLAQNDENLNHFAPGNDKSNSIANINKCRT
jgi:hypothetical protein